MDKNKVEEHLDDAIAFLDYLKEYLGGCSNERLANALVAIDMAKKELSKPDWISVEDELPDYEESVLVTSSEDTEEIYFSHRTKRPDVVVDNNGFTTYVGAPKITHWQRIKKLEE